MGSLPTGTSLPSGSSKPTGTSLPSGTSLPAGTTTAGFGLRAIFLTAPPIFYLDSSRAGTITTSGGVVSAWSDPDSGLSATASGATQPAYSAADANFNNQPSVTGDGTDDFMATTLDLPAPGTTPTFIFSVVRVITHTSARQFWGSTTNVMALNLQAASPNLFIRNTTAGPSNGNLTLGTAGAVACFYNNAVTDYIRVGSAAAATGTNVGNTDPGATFGLFARSSTGGASINGTICLFCVCQAAPTPGEYTAALAYCNATFGTAT